MYEPVWHAVVRRTGPYRKCNASLSGYMRRSVIDQEYPAALKGEEMDSVNGVLYFYIDTDDLVRLDKFEGDFYVRIEEIVKTDSGQNFRAYVYVLKDEYMCIASSSAWNQVNFETSGIQKFLDEYKGFDQLSL